jgi:hypothetical protein
MRHQAALLLETSASVEIHAQHQAKLRVSSASSTSRHVPSFNFRQAGLDRGFLPRGDSAGIAGVLTISGCANAAARAFWHFL